MRRSLLFAVLSLSLLLSALVAAPAALYTFTPIDVPGAEYTRAFRIDDNGRIVGLFRDATGRDHGFLKDGTTFTTIDVPGAAGTSAWSINDSGRIVGWFSDGTRLHGFLKDGTTFTTIDVPGAALTSAYGINTAGQIVGLFSYDDASGLYHGFLKDGATFTTFDVPGAELTEAIRINDSGQIVGWFRDSTRFHGFLKDGATFTTFDVPGAEWTFSYGINDDSQIVGGVTDGQGVRSSGFLKDGTTFTTIDVPGAMSTQPLGINNNGQIVGLFSDSTMFHGFLATPVLVDTTPPMITVSASPTTLWPSNGRRVAVTVSGTITDAEPGGSGVKAGSAAYVVMDEYGQIQPHGSLTLGAGGSYAFTVALEASRRGNDWDGRHYTIAVSAQDNRGFVANFQRERGNAC
jgi:uncharacterized membrane protein